MNFVVDNSITGRKLEILAYFKNRGEESLEEINRHYSTKQYKQISSEINKAIVETRNKLIPTIVQKSKTQNWSRIELLNSILLVTYCSYISMINFRNAVWSYDYMSFSRRIGELWEPFCKICFEYPINELELFVPPLFSDVKKRMTSEKEEENNQYFRQLRDSSVWTAYCGDKTYAEINKFTGFDLKEWIEKNIDWKNDLQKETREWLERHNLLKYLVW